jgi:hypothetical protein
MSFKDLIGLTETDEQRRKAAEGFAERQAAREKKFRAEAEALEPSAEWYDRMYGKRAAKSKR